jgi:predicted ATPase/DNA-binding winged helix-turn-helix (wHTH) protein
MTRAELTSSDITLAWGEFRLSVTQRVLSAGDRPVRVGSRALEILFALLERPGEVVSKNELMARVWPGVYVEEGTLRVHIAALRKILGHNHAGTRYVENVTGLGYRFVAPVTVIDDSVGAGIANARQSDPFPVELVQTIGRVQAIDKLLAQVPMRRLVTVVGAGGIGKTTLALAVAERLRASYPDGVYLVSLAGISDSARVASAVASAFRQPVLSQDPLPAVANYLGAKKLLLVLDNCEHVIEAAALSAEYLLSHCGSLHILATSREPLGATGEWVQRLGPLEIPGGDDLTAPEALRFSAIQLFVERATAGTGNFQLTDAEAPLVIAICRKLDGLPLAIELAAAAVDRFGLRALANRLDDRFQVLRTGRRTAFPRHKTLRATLDWSYDILSAPERDLLRKTAVFAGCFDSASAAQVAGSAHFTASEVSDTLADLTAKSLLTAEFASDEVYYRFPNTARAYALEKLEESGEAGAVRRRHAELCRGWAWPEADEATCSPAARIDDIRGALEWSFSAAGDASLGSQLILSSAELWFRLAFLDEYGHRVERALRLLEATPGHDLGVEMELNLLLGEIVLYLRGPIALVSVALDSAYQLASRLHVRSVARECVWAMHCERVRSGDYWTALSHAERWRDSFDSAAMGAQSSNRENSHDSLGDRMLCMAHYLLGNHAQARVHIDKILARELAKPARTRYPTFQWDDRATALAVLARLLWIQGFPREAADAARAGIERSVAVNNVLSTCFSLSSAATVHIWTGDSEEASTLADQLEEFATRHSLDYWQRWARCVRWGAARTDPTRSQSRAALVTDFDSTTHLETLATFDDSLPNESLILRAERGMCGWCAPELLRVKAVSMLRAGSAPLSDVETTLQASLTLAQQQGALAWELRTASTLGEVWAESGRASAALKLLRGVLARFTEGQSTADVVAASALVNELSQ